jgi:hypothetical protein
LAVIVTSNGIAPDDPGGDDSGDCADTIVAENTRRLADAMSARRGDLNMGFLPWPTARVQRLHMLSAGLLARGSSPVSAFPV